MRAYGLFRRGVMLCCNRAIGPVPPVRDPNFRFDNQAEDGSWWRILHSAPSCFIVEISTDDNYYYEFLEGLPGSLMSNNFIGFMQLLNDAAISSNTNLENLYARDIYRSLGYFTKDDILNVCDSSEPVWRFSELWEELVFSSVAEEEAAGFFP